MKYTIYQIIESVAEFSGLTYDQIMSRTNKHKIVRPRQMAMMIAYDYCGMSQGQIAFIFGFADHTAVISCRNRIGMLYDSDDDYADTYDQCVKYVRETVIKDLKIDLSKIPTVPKRTIVKKIALKPPPEPVKLTRSPAPISAQDKIFAQYGV